MTSGTVAIIPLAPASVFDLGVFVLNDSNHLTEIVWPSGSIVFFVKESRIPFFHQLAIRAHCKMG